MSKMTTENKTIDLLAKELLKTKEQVNLLVQVAMKQSKEINHLQLAVLSIQEPFNARCMIDGKMIQYRNGKQVDE